MALVKCLSDILVMFTEGRASCSFCSVMSFWVAVEFLAIIRSEGTSVKEQGDLEVEGVSA